MPLREFIDPAGRTWKVWSVYPQYADRREAHRQGIPRPGGERRHHEEPRVQLDGPFRHGWLTFESANERRRLAPIPPGWDDGSDEALLRLCERATPVEGPRA